jgi:MarC family integral membrane protein
MRAASSRAQRLLIFRVVQASKFEFVVNLKAAKALEASLSQALLVTAMSCWSARPFTGSPTAWPRSAAQRLRFCHGFCATNALPANPECFSMLLDFLVSALVTLVVVVDPVGLAPTFVAVTSGLPNEARRQVALRAPAIAGAILAGTALIGDWLLRQLGISLPAFAPFSFLAASLKTSISVHSAVAKRSGALLHCQAPFSFLAGSLKTSISVHSAVAKRSSALLHCQAPFSFLAASLKTSISVHSAVAKRSSASPCIR